MRRVIFDQYSGRPYCVLLQAVMGGDHSVVSACFPAEEWIVNPTPNNKAISIPGTIEQFNKFAKLTPEERAELFAKHTGDNTNE